MPSGGIIMTLPGYFQIEARKFASWWPRCETADLAVGRRWPRAGGLLERLAALGVPWPARLGHASCSSTTWPAAPAPSGARCWKRSSSTATSTGSWPCWPTARDFRVAEVDLRQSPLTASSGVYGPREYFRGVLDIFTVFFLVRFTKRPLRFFGMLGMTTFGLGALWTLLLVVQRLFFDQALADRPALLLSSLLLVIGLQLFALGLLGELIIFTHARQLKDYQVSEIIYFAAQEPEPGMTQRAKAIAS